MPTFSRFFGRRSKKSRPLRKNSAWLNSIFQYQNLTTWNKISFACLKHNAQNDWNGYCKKVWKHKSSATFWAFWKPLKFCTERHICPAITSHNRLIFNSLAELLAPRQHQLGAEWGWGDILHTWGEYQLPVISEKGRKEVQGRERTENRESTE